MACRNPILDSMALLRAEPSEREREAAAHVRGEQVAFMTDAFMAFQARWPNATVDDVAFAARVGGFLDVFAVDVEIGARS